MNQVRSIIDHDAIGATQITVFVLCFMLNFIDGMDVLVISFTAPVIASKWDIAAETLGAVFSAGLVGMTLGAMLLAPLADRFGRRNLIMTSVVIIATGTLLTAAANSVTQLILLRAVSGLGIGALLASVATMAAEYAPNRHRNFIVSVCVAGYPVGATVAGIVAAEIIPAYGWHAMFLVAGFVTIGILPFVWYALPESMSFLLEKQPRDALRKLNRVLKRMGRSEIDALPEIIEQENPGAGPRTLFLPGLASGTALLWLAFFMSFVTLYFLLSWIPKLSFGMGLSLDLAIYAGAVFNLGAVVGIALQGYLSQHFGLQRTIFVFLITTALLMAFFEMFKGSTAVLPVFGILGFLMQGGFVGLYVVAARLYPTVIRNTGVGWAIGAGRTGAILGPMAGGMLIGMGLSMIDNFLVFAVPVALAAFATLAIRVPED